MSSLIRVFYNKIGWDENLAVDSWMERYTLLVKFNIILNDSVLKANKNKCCFICVFKRSVRVC
jgi:hypothetical protein